MLSWLRQWFGEDDAVHSTRMTPPEVIAVAKEAAKGEPLHERLQHAKVREQSGTLIWYVSSDGKGATLIVTVDDATGEVLETALRGVR
jgi:hypothetical protein